MGVVKTKQNIKKRSYHVAMLRECVSLSLWFWSLWEGVLSHTAPEESKQAQSYIHLLMLVCEYS